jgi:hypothetical protein
MKEKLKVVTPIKPELRGLLEEFLADETYQQLFMSFAKHLGYTGDDIEEAKLKLFTAEDTEIGFTVAGMYDAFLEFQLFKQLIDREPYKSLLTKYPTRISMLRVLAKKILAKEPVGAEDIKIIFADEAGEDNSSK